MQKWSARDAKAGFSELLEASIEQDLRACSPPSLKALLLTDEGRANLNLASRKQSRRRAVRGHG